MRLSFDMLRVQRNIGAFPNESEIEWSIIDPFGTIDLWPQYRINADSNEYWSWIVTTSGFIFGVSRANDTDEPWLWAGWSIPTSGPRDDERWKPQHRAEEFVDWSGWVGFGE